jgi:hypothetical protein
MNHKRFFLATLIALMVVTLGATACKHSGVALTGRGQILDIEIEGADDLPDGFTDKLTVTVANRGVANIGNVEFTVEMPNELVVLQEKHSDGLNVMEMRSPEGNRVFHFVAGAIEPMTKSEASFQVRTSFGSLDRSGDVKVTAWQKDLPSDTLVETKMIKLRR